MAGWLHIPAVEAALARRDDPALRQAPLLFVSTGPGAPTVVTCSPDARRAGVQPGMALNRALLACPGATCHPHNPHILPSLTATLLALVAAEAPRAAPAASSTDADIQFDLEITQQRPLWEAAQRIGRRTRATLGLLPAIGLAASPFCARQAALAAAPRGLRAIPAGQEAAFLAPLPIETLPLDAHALQRLRLLGLTTLGALAALPPGALASQLGATGDRIQALASGQDRALLPLLTPGASIRAGWRFAGPVADTGILHTALQRVATRLAARLAATGQQAGALELVLSLEHGPDQPRTRILSRPLCHAPELGAALVMLATAAPIPAGVLAAVVTLSRLIPLRTRQLAMFEARAGDQPGSIVQDLRARLGPDRLLRAAVVRQDARLLEQRIALYEAEPV